MEYMAPSKCPVCGQDLHITQLACPKCGSEISGNFAICRYCTLNEKLKLFLDAFIKCRGSIKDVENMLSISYPTVKGLLDDLVASLFPETVSSHSGCKKADSKTVLDQLENGEITAAEAAEILSQK